MLWRAWSHYKAWRGALYLEALITSDTIVEGVTSGNTDLDAVYEGRGGEDHAPDATSTPRNLTGQLTPHEDVTQTPSIGVPNPANVEVAPDTTATPDAMVFPGEKSEVTLNPPASTANSDDLFLNVEQVPFLASQFHLLPSEIVDISRAVEQAELRVQKGNGGGTAWKGNLHR